MRKITIFIAVAMVAASGLVYAGGQQEAAGDGEGSDKPLVLWHTEFTTEWAGRQQVVNYFEENTELDVAKDYGPSLYREMSKKFIIQAETGNPDVLEGTHEQMLSYAKAGLLLPLDEYFANDPNAEAYNENVLKPLRYKGKLYGVPYNTNVRLLLYRKSVFEKHGLAIPSDWDELVETAVKINELEPEMQGFMFTTKTREVRAFQEFMSFYFQLNRDMFQSEGDSVTCVADKAELQQVLQLYHDMFFEGAIDLSERGGDWKALDYGYTEGKYAMVTVGPWIWGHREGNPERADVLDDTGITAIPVASNGQPGTYMELKPIMINKYTDDKDRSYKLLQEVTSKGFQIKVDLLRGVLPGRQDAFEDPKISNNWWVKGFGEYMDTGVALDPVSWEKAQNAIISAIQSTIYEEMSVADVADQLLAELQDAAAEM